MKRHTTNYHDTFIEIAEDCPAMRGEVPPARDDAPTVAGLQFDIISKHPYQYTSDDVLFHVYARRNELTEEELEQAREQFFSKGQPCLRSSPLTKRYGWGVHCNFEGKIAIYGCETGAYKRFLADENIEVVKAMKSRR